MSYERFFGAESTEDILEPESQNYYDILGISPTASAEEIKKAFRRKAKETDPHFDTLNMSEAEKERRAAGFRRIHEAYDVLSDTVKRAKYDEYGGAHDIATETGHTTDEQDRREKLKKAIRKEWATQIASYRQSIAETESSLVLKTGNSFSKIESVINEVRTAADHIRKGEPTSTSLIYGGIQLAREAIRQCQQDIESVAATIDVASMEVFHQKLMDFLDSEKEQKSILATIKRALGVREGFLLRLKTLEESLNSSERDLIDLIARLQG